jgi:hypothetical protein
MEIFLHINQTKKGNGIAEERFNATNTKTQRLFDDGGIIDGKKSERGCFTGSSLARCLHATLLSLLLFLSFVSAFFQEARDVPSGRRSSLS